jgi:hypothetical protein
LGDKNIDGWKEKRDPLLFHNHQQMQEKSAEEATFTVNGPQDSLWQDECNERQYNTDNPDPINMVEKASDDV